MLGQSTTLEKSREHLLRFHKCFGVVTCIYIFSVCLFVLSLTGSANKISGTGQFCSTDLCGTIRSLSSFGTAMFCVFFSLNMEKVNSPVVSSCSITT